MCIYPYPYSMCTHTVLYTPTQYVYPYSMCTHILYIPIQYVYHAVCVYTHIVRIPAVCNTIPTQYNVYPHIMLEWMFVVNQYL